MFERYTEKANPATLPEVQHQSREMIAAADPSVGVDRALALLQRADIRSMVLAGISTDSRHHKLTESYFIQSLTRAGAPVLLVESVCAHAKWSLRRYIRIALLRNENTPLARVLEFAHSLPIRQLREILRSCRLPSRTREYL